MVKFSFFKTAEKEKFLVLDIGTEAVKDLVFKKEGGKIVVLEESSEYFDEFSLWDSRNFKEDVIKKAILKTLQNLTLKDLPLILSLPANVFKSRISFQSFSRKNQKDVIVEKEERLIQEDVIKEARKRIRDIFYLETGILSKDLEFLELKILETKIDGYEVPGLKGYGGQTLEFRILANFILKSHLETFNKIISSLNLKVFKIVHPSQALTGLFQTPNAIFFDIGGEVTQFFIVKNGKLEVIDNFKVGGQDFSQEFSERLGLDQVRARKLKKDYSQGLLSEEVRQRIKEILSSAAQNWLKELKLKVTAKKILFPFDIFLFGGGSLIPEIQEVLEQSFSESHQIRYLYPKDLKGIKVSLKILTSPKDVPILLLCYL
ncbi:MAG: hypothetical protein CMI54_01010 [Parcubacteria group bacterium]|jgi:cell division ATPase FtsA|nr:hypothetical protein [Parcubacteria group bacterium]|tara:strand:+ start:21936 stop:23060 length:1125 start_codon:yes stop_codon:yes gene_type:complete